MDGLVTWLFVPGAAERFMAKLPSLAPDVAVLDLEDGVAPGEREAARERIARSLAPAAPFPVRLAVRVNPVGSSAFERDLVALGPRLFALLIPKVAEPQQLTEAARRLAELGLHGVRLIPMIESALGLRNSLAILTAHASVGGVALGAEDLAADLGLGLAAKGAAEAALEARQAVMTHARAELIVAAAAAGVTARIESPQLSLRDDETVTAAASRARGFGFTGMLAVHPAQLKAVRQGFQLSDSEREHAAAIAALGSGGRAVEVDGRMVDGAVVRQAAGAVGMDDES